ncbi:MAG TPA: rod shape-determining protein MreC [Candidatus Limnocylindria bacterium]|nr:rod shape-determining protein MreC [Candidatus Limnocylindria bacterium]
MKRAHYIAFALVIVATIVVLKLPPRAATQFKLAIGSFFLPLFGLASSSQQLAEKAGNAVVPRKELLKQNEQLRRENAELRTQLQRDAELERENERLRGLLGFQKTSPLKLKAAHVIARDPANWWRNVRIDLGKRDGLRVDLPVRTAEGLVGRVSEVSETSSRVVLLGDANCRVPAEITDAQGRQTVDRGVITGGAGVLDESMVELSFLSKPGAVKPGQLVKTSGDSSFYPAGILIGEVVDTRPENFGLVHVARVKLAVKMHLLDEVFVMMQ